MFYREKRAENFEGDFSDLDQDIFRELMLW